MHTITKAILDWYDINKRTLPWRDEVTPYRTLISEIMLQQTRVDTVIPYFNEFLLRFPNVETLASATQDDVLSKWSGLGYYSRARNLHKAAKLIVEQGGFPTTLIGIRKLPGVGEYITGAIGSIAFDIDTAAVDGNHHRVLSRLYRNPGTRKDMWEVANSLLPSGRCSDFNQALMDIGSQICTNKSPKCQQCPINTSCEAYISKEVDRFPIKKPKKKIPIEEFIALRAFNDKKLLLALRPSKGLYGGMYEPPMLKIVDSTVLSNQLQTEFSNTFNIKLNDIEKIDTVEHVLTHKKMVVHIFSASVTASPTLFGTYVNIQWHDIESLNLLGISTLASKILKANKYSQLSLFPTMKS